MDYTWIKQKGTQFCEWVLGIDKKVFRCILFVLLFIDAVLWSLGSVLQKIHVGAVEEYYETYLEFRHYIPVAVRQIIKDFKIPFLILTIIDLIFLIWRRRYILVSLCSFSPDLSEAVVNKKNRWIFKKHLDLCEEMQDMAVPDAVAKADEFVAKVLRERGSSELGIYGIMHTPLLFRIGYDFGDQSNTDFYHKARTNDSNFEIWKKETDRYCIAFVEKNQDVKSDEMIVSIATSFEIRDYDIECLHPETKHILRFDGSHYDFDALRNSDDATTIRNQIVKEIRMESKKYGIRKIHMVISSSVAFTLFLGMAYSKQHDPECVVYHFEKGSYPWGISICSSADTCFVRVK